jgi:Flp pilus assembly protein TadG
MSSSSDRSPEQRRKETGNISLFVAVGLIGLLGVMALGIDVGLGYTSRAQLHASADAVALAAASNMIDQENAAVTLGDADTAATDVASHNFAVPASGLSVDAADMTYGTWDLDNSTLVTGVDLTDPDQVTGVETIMRLDDTVNPAVRPLLARVLGIDRFNVRATATAYLGFAGNLGPGDVDLPLVVPCCELTGDEACEQDYCDGGPPVPNPCPLLDSQTNIAGNVSCLEFFNTPNQTACWTQFDGSSPSINTNNLRDIVNNSLPGEVTVDDSIYLDNGTKTPVVESISDRFYGDGAFLGSPAGTDRYPPIQDPPVSDSWIIGFPVVECQNADHCASGDTADVVGFVCFELIEVQVTPEKIIRGRFLCPDDHPDQVRTCLEGLGPTGTGGENFGIRADRPVLVR